MPSSAKGFERRKSKRYKIQGGAFAVLKPRSNSTKLGSIIDISTGGLSFYFIDTKDHENEANEWELDIFLSGYGFLIDQIPFKVISEVILPKEIPFYSVVTRRFGIQFEPMPLNKSSKLKLLIRTHALTEIPPDTPA